MSIEIDAEFRFYCTDCKQHTFTKFEDIQNNSNGRGIGVDSAFQNGHNEMSGPYRIGLCLGCGQNIALYIRLESQFVSQSQLVEIAQQEVKKQADLLEKSKQQQKREGSLI